MLPPLDDVIFAQNFLILIYLGNFFPNTSKYNNFVNIILKTSYKTTSYNHIQWFVSMHGRSQEFELDGSKAKKSNHMVIVFKLMQISLNVLIQKFKIMNNDLGSGDKPPSA